MSRQQIVDIKPFAYDNFPPNGFVLILGKRGTGKSTWTKYICSKLDDCQQGIVIVMGGSGRVREAWSECVPPLYVVPPSIDYLERLRKEREKVIKKYASMGKKVPVHMHVTIIIDDVSADKNFMKSAILAWLASNGRHLELTVILLAQYVFQVPAEIRTQFDLVYVLSTSNRRAIQTLHSEYVGHTDIRVFRPVLSAMTENKGALIIDNRSSTASISDTCFYGKIKPWPQPKVTLGNPLLWKYSRVHYHSFEENSSSTRSRTRSSELGKLISNGKEEDEDDDDDHDTSAALEFLQTNRRIYSDRIGRIVVRCTGGSSAASSIGHDMLGKPKTKKD
jgi:hypothetical protein